MVHGTEEHRNHTDELVERVVLTAGRIHMFVNVKMHIDRLTKVKCRCILYTAMHMHMVITSLYVYSNNIIYAISHMYCQSLSKPLQVPPVSLVGEPSKF